MSALAPAFRQWVAFCSRREQPFSLALLRIFVGLAVLGDLLVAWQLDLVPDLWAPPPHGLGYGATERNPPWTIAWLGATPESTHWVYLWAVFSGALLVTGTLTRVAGISLALASAQLSMISPSADRGIDDLMRIACALIGLSGAGAVWSGDAWIRKLMRRAPIERVLAWPRNLLFAQLLWVYFSAAQHRGDEDWWFRGGLSALAKILRDPHFSRVPPEWVDLLFPFTQVGTLSTMVFEFSAPFMLAWTWFARTPTRPGKIRWVANQLRLRWVWMSTGVFFHLGIAMTMRLGMFPFGMLALYPALLHPDELVRAARRVRGLLRPGTSVAS